MVHDTLNKQDTDFTRLTGAVSLPTMETVWYNTRHHFWRSPWSPLPFPDSGVPGASLQPTC